MDELVVNTISKVMIVDADGVIIDNHTNLFGSAFEEELLGLLNQ